MLTELQAAYIAGFLDGDGYITIARPERVKQEIKRLNAAEFSRWYA